MIIKLDRTGHHATHPIPSASHSCLKRVAAASVLSTALSPFQLALSVDKSY